MLYTTTSESLAQKETGTYLVWHPIFSLTASLAWYSVRVLPIIKTRQDLHTRTRLTALWPGLPGWASTRKENQSGFYWSKRQWVAVASTGPYASLITTPVPHHSVCLQAGCPSCHPTNSVKALKTRLNTKYRLHIQFQHLKLPTLKCRRLCGDMIEVFKITHNICNPDYHLNWNIITRVVALEVININFLITHYIWLTQNTIFCMHRWYLE